jgi:hypothetical protein
MMASEKKYVRQESWRKNQSAGLQRYHNAKRESETEKFCVGCQQMVSKQNFKRRSRQKPHLLTHRCDTCRKQLANEKASSWYWANKPLATALNWKYRLKRNFGMTIEAYDLMVAAQDGKCAICGNSEAGGVKRKLVVDHEHHGAKRVRGLLCGNCNSGIGMLRDDPTIVLAAFAYLARYIDPSTPAANLSQVDLEIEAA